MSFKNTKERLSKIMTKSYWMEIKVQKDGRLVVSEKKLL